MKAQCQCHLPPTSAALQVADFRLHSAATIERLLHKWFGSSVASFAESAGRPVARSELEHLDANHTHPSPAGGHWGEPGDDPEPDRAAEQSTLQSKAGAGPGLPAGRFHGPVVSGGSFL